jgi:hypothetical protein
MPLGTGTKIYAGLAGASLATGLGVSALRYKKHGDEWRNAPPASDRKSELGRHIFGPGVAGTVGSAFFGRRAKVTQDMYKDLHAAGFKGFRDAYRSAKSYYESGGTGGFDPFKEAFRRASGGRRTGGGSRASSSAAGTSHKDIFKEWGVPEGASPEDVKKAYRARAKVFHPDRNPDKDTTQMMKDLNAQAERLRQMGKMAELGFHKTAKFDYHDVEDHLGLYLDDKTEASVNRMIGQQKAKRWALRHPVASLGVGYAIAKENAVHEITKNLFRKHKKLQDKSLLARKIRMYENPAYYR